MKKVCRIEFYQISKNKLVSVRNMKIYFGGQRGQQGRGRERWVFIKDVSFCKDHRDKTEIPDPLAIGDLISHKLNNRRKLARLITQYWNRFFRKARPSFLRVLQRMTKVLNVTSLKYGKYDITNEKAINNKRLIDRAR